MVLKIFRAADAFLYLPTYVAEEYGIFETLLKPLGITKVEFSTSNGGDIGAIKEMLSENNNSNDSISIAIGDPTAFLSKRLKNMEIDQVSVIGAIINKLPFWAVNHTDRVFDSIFEFGKKFSTVIHYKENLITGYYLGSKVKNSSKISDYEAVGFGEEIPALTKHNTKIGSKAVAITADIVSLVKGLSNATDTLIINYRFSKEGNFITTGVITSKKCCDNSPNQLNKIIEAIQKSISILYSSEKIGEKICTAVSQKPQFNSVPLSSIEILKIIELINEEKFYPADLNITKDSWNQAVKALAKTEHWESEDETESIKNSFEKYVDNRFILNSEKSIADQFGINLDTFDKEIEEKIIAPLKTEMQTIQLELEAQEKKIGKSFPLFLWLSRNISSFLLMFNNKIVKIVGLIVAVISVSVYLLQFVNDVITMKDIYTSLILGFFASTISAIFILVIQSIQKKKNETKN